MLKKELETNFTTCNSNINNVERFTHRIVTSVFIDCSNLAINVVVFYERGLFLWIPKAKQQTNKFFGDHDRALNKY